MSLNGALGNIKEQSKTMCELFIVSRNPRNLPCSVCGKDRSDLIRLFPKTWHHYGWWQPHDDDDILVCGVCKDISEVVNDRQNTRKNR